MNAPMFAGRMGGPSSVYPVIRVRYSGDLHRYNAVARWDDYVARGTAAESPNTRTASESAVLAAWAAHVKLAEKVHAPRAGEDVEWWAARLAEKCDATRYVVIVTDESDILPGGRGGYLVTFADSVTVVRDTTPRDGSRVRFDAYGEVTFETVDGAAGIYRAIGSGARLQVNSDATAWEYVQ